MSAVSTVGVAVVTYNAERYLRPCLEPILASPLKPKVLVIDSSSRDGTAAIAHALGVETHVIPQSQFNHGSTRELARSLLGTDIAVMLTQDVIPVEAGMLERLIAPIAEGRAAVAYARQIPHNGAGFFEAFPRAFNYPEHSELRGKEDLLRMGPYVFFCSDSCCAWLNKALDEIGGFGPTLSLEDTLAAAKLVHSGYKLAYCADAVVKHSHKYSLKQEFQRYFDIGYVREKNKDLLFVAGGDEDRGKDFVKTMLRQLLREKPLLIPYALMVAASKLAGFKIGARSGAMPLWLKKRLSGQPYYWSSVGFD